MAKGGEPSKKSWQMTKNEWGGVFWNGGGVTTYADLEGEGGGQKNHVYSTVQNREMSIR